MKKSIMASDVDGVLVEPGGLGGIACVSYLHENGLFDDLTFGRFMSHVERYRRDGNYFIMMEGVTREYARGLKGRNRKLVRDLAGRFFNERKEFICPYAEELLGLFGENYVKVIISSSSFEFLEPIAKHLSFDKPYASKAATDGDIYTGEMEIDMSTTVSKEIAFCDAAKEFNTGFDGSFWFGDTEHDMFVYNRAENAYAVNPIEPFKTYAEKQGIPILTKNNIIPEVRKRLNAIQNP